MTIIVVLAGSFIGGTALGLIAVWVGLSLGEDHILPL